MAAPIEVTVYGRPGCHLCEEAVQLLGKLSRRIPLTVRELNIEDDDELLGRYVFEIPVVLVAGVEIARAPIRQAALEQALRRLVQDAGRS